MIAVETSKDWSICTSRNMGRHDVKISSHSLPNERPVFFEILLARVPMNSGRRNNVTKTVNHEPTTNSCERNWSARARRNITEERLSHD